MTGELTQERLKELLDYNHNTGELTWRVSRGNVSAGRRAGSPLKGRYTTVRVDDGMYYAHRLVWFWLTGAWPDGEIDHINGNKHDNSVKNLRVVTRGQNARNILQTRGSSRFPSVGWLAHRQKWRARFIHNGEETHLGVFSSEREAFAAYLMEVAEHVSEEDAQIIYNRAMTHNQH